jgi:hypothetical protein
LNLKFREIGILKDNDVIDNHNSFFSVFKNVWANNADQISMMYSGTGALKNDFTRTGKRSFYGLLNDGLNSAIRYYLNNFKFSFYFTNIKKGWSKTRFNESSSWKVHCQSKRKESISTTKFTWILL